MLRGQEMTLAVHKMRLSDDPNLALAYGHALRTLTVPSVDSVGSARQFHPRERRYLDSTTLQHQLIEVLASCFLPTSTFSRVALAPGSAWEVCGVVNRVLIPGKPWWRLCACIH
jgi:hypothetical protein